jgi:hypothetical protein
MGFRDKRQNKSKQIQEKEVERHTDKIQPDRERDIDTERQIYKRQRKKKRMTDRES